MDSIPEQERDVLRNEMLAYIQSKYVLPINKGDWASLCGKKEEIYYGKFPEKIEVALKDGGYLRTTGDRLELDSSLFGILLCMAAKYLGKVLTSGEDYYTLFTNRYEFELCNYDPINSLKTERCLQILLNEFLPIPDSTVPIKEVLRFKQDNFNELLLLRCALDSLLTQLKQEVHPERALAAAKDEVAGHLGQVAANMRRSNMRIAFVSLSVIIPTLLVMTVPSAVHYIPFLFSGAAMNACMEFRERFIRPVNRPEESAYSYLYLAKRSFD